MRESVLMEQRTDRRGSMNSLDELEELARDDVCQQRRVVDEANKLI